MRTERRPRDPIGRVARPPDRIVRHGSRALRVLSLRSPARPLVVGPLPGAGLPSAAGVRRTIDELVAEGHDLVVTPALDRVEREPFLEAGGEVVDELHLLTRSLESLADLDAGAGDVEAHAVPLRRARRRDWEALEALDGRAFDAFWHFGTDELADALAATRTARLRVAGEADPVGYVVAGRAGSIGFVQRLAVDPAAQGRGVGSALLVDALRWLRRRGARTALVNTQRTNERALALYRRHGFTIEPSGLSVVAFRKADR